MADLTATDLAKFRAMLTADRCASECGHYDCAIARLCDEVERLQMLVSTKIQVAHEVVFAHQEMRRMMDAIVEATGCWPSEDGFESRAEFARRALSFLPRKPTAN